jgi:hypothetical protein
MTATLRILTMAVLPRNGNLTTFNPILPAPEPNPGVQLRDIADFKGRSGPVALGLRFLEQALNGWPEQMLKSITWEQVSSRSNAIQRVRPQ